MNHLVSGEPVWELMFDEHGTLSAPDRGKFLDELTNSNVEDLFIFSHGWNNDHEQARALYRDMFPMLADASGSVEALGQVGFAGVLWPSIWFPETPAHVPPVADSEQ